MVKTSAKHSGKGYRFSLSAPWSQRSYSAPIDHYYPGSRPPGWSSSRAPGPQETGAQDQERGDEKATPSRCHLVDTKRDCQREEQLDADRRIPARPSACHSNGQTNGSPASGRQYVRRQRSCRSGNEREYLVLG